MSLSIEARRGIWCPDSRQAAFSSSSGHEEIIVAPAERAEPHRMLLPHQHTLELLSLGGAVQHA